MVRASPDRPRRAPVTSVAALLTPADRKRLLERLRELRALDREMRAPGSLAAPDQPLPLHRAAAEETRR